MEQILNWIFSPKPYICLAVVLVCLLLWCAVRRFVRKVIAQGDKKSGVAAILLNVTKYFLFALCVLVILQVNGINVSSAIAGLGIAGAIVGLALQDALKDIIMGVNIISEEFFHPGDIIKIGEYSGKVTNLSLKSTQLVNNEEGYEIRICNRNIDKVLVYNEVMVLDIPLSYGESADAVKSAFELITSDIAAWKDVKKVEYLGLQAYQDSSVLYRLRLTVSPVNRATVKRRALQKVDATLRERGISIPFPQLDVHLDKD
ncbi:MAG: mechanosensitive ion channel family protein [Clostridiales bacterium]|nr:mechanosensitive ion channel family protein [Clostridiales bacterium]